MTPLEIAGFFIDKKNKLLYNYLCEQRKVKKNE